MVPIHGQDVEAAAAKFAKEQPAVGLLEASVKPSKGAKEATVAIQAVGAEPTTAEVKEAVAVVEEAFSRCTDTPLIADNATSYDFCEVVAGLWYTADCPSSESCLLRSAEEKHWSIKALKA